MNKGLLIGILLFILGQITTWYQGNLQFFNTWAKDNPVILSLFGIPVSYLFIQANKYTVFGMGGQLWPSKLIGFATGMIIMATLTYLHMNQGISMKTAVTLLLSAIILFIQIFWK